LAGLVDERRRRPRDEPALARRRDQAMLVFAPAAVCDERLAHRLGVFGGGEELPEEASASVFVVLAAGELGCEVIEARDSASGVTTQKMLLAVFTTVVRKSRCSTTSRSAC